MSQPLLGFIILCIIASICIGFYRSQKMTGVGGSGLTLTLFISAILMLTLGSCNFEKLVQGSLGFDANVGWLTSGLILLGLAIWHLRYRRLTLVSRQK